MNNNQKTLQDIRLILIDIDGTFIDSHRSLISQHIKIAKLMGLREPSEKEIRDKLAMPWHLLLKSLWPDVDVELFQRRYMEEPREYTLKPFDGVVELTKQLKKHYMVGIVTGKSMRGVKNNFKDLGISLEGFKVIMTGDMPIAKPDPKVFTDILDELDLKPKEVIYIGDAILDYECASKAEINFIGVLTGNVKKEDFRQAGADLILDSLADLPSVIAR